MFLGTYNAQLSDGGRITIPRKIHRQVNNGEVVLFVGLERCIVGFNKDIWQETTRSVREKPFFSDSQGRDERRKLNMSAGIAGIDTQARIVIPDNMLRYAGITDAVTVVGAGDHFEIWDKKTWEEYLKEL